MSYKGYIGLAIICGGISAGISQYLGASLGVQLVVFFIATLATLLIGPTLIGMGDDL